MRFFPFRFSSCYYCGEYQFSHTSATAFWLCQHCDQHNFFDENTKNEFIQTQSLRPHHPPALSISGDTRDEIEFNRCASSAQILCHQCSRNQRLFAEEKASIDAADEQDLEIMTAKLESKYQLCLGCQIAVRDCIEAQNQSIGHLLTKSWATDRKRKKVRCICTASIALLLYIQMCVMVKIYMHEANLFQKSALMSYIPYVNIVADAIKSSVNRTLFSKIFLPTAWMPLLSEFSYALCFTLSTELVTILRNRLHSSTYVLPINHNRPSDSFVRFLESLVLALSLSDISARKDLAFEFILTIMIVECWALQKPAFGAINLPYYQPTNPNKERHVGHSAKPRTSSNALFDNIASYFNGLWANMWKSREATTPVHISVERSQPITASRRSLLDEEGRIRQDILDSHKGMKSVGQRTLHAEASLLPYSLTYGSAYNHGDHQRRTHQKILKSSHDDQIEALINRISISEPKPVQRIMPEWIRTFAGRLRWIVILPHIMSTFSMNPRIMVLDAIFCLVLVFYFRPKSISARHILESLKRRDKSEILRILAVLYLCYNVAFIISHLTGATAFIVTAIQFVWNILNMWDTILFATVRSFLFGSICYLVLFNTNNN